MRSSISTIEIHAPAFRVWDALVNPTRVKAWQYGSDLKTTWEPGSPIRFITAWQDKVFEQWGTVLEFDLHKKIRYSLFAPRPDLADIPQNYFYMTYVLEENHGVTKLTIIQDDPRPPMGERQGDDEAGKAVLNGLKKLVEECS